MSSAEKPPVRRRVWRITQDDPKGTYVDAGKAPPADAGKAPPAESTSVEERHSGWAVSSFELRYGLDVSDADDTVPAELLDNLFNRPRS